MESDCEISLNANGEWCYPNNAIWWWFLMWVCAHVCTKICFNAWLAERLLMCHKPIPVHIRGLPVCVRGGRLEISHMGSPCTHNGVVRIWGVTYIYQRTLWSLDRPVPPLLRWSFWYCLMLFDELNPMPRFLFKLVFSGGLSFSTLSH